MPSSTDQYVERLVQQIHSSQAQVVLTLSGGGSRAISELLEVPGGSQTLLEAIVPYSAESLIRLIGSRPDQFCSSRTARAMAMAAFRRACGYSGPSSHMAGVGCTAGLVTDLPRKGGHRVHVALQTAISTTTWALELHKGLRNRVEEEELVWRLVLNVVAEAGEVEQRLPLGLSETEQIDKSRTVASSPWQDLLLGKTEAVCQGQASSRAILPGAFNPLHAGHRGMAEVAAQMLDVPVTMEVSILNVDKPPLDYFEIERRVAQFSAEQPVWLTRAATFEEKSRLFPDATFVVGVDTLRRIAAPRYYGDDLAACLASLGRIADRGCRFLVFGRDVGTGFVRLGDLDVPEVLRAICRDVPAERFRQDVSSTAIRNAGQW